MTYPQLPAGTNRSTGSLCWGRASPGKALCLSSSCMSSTWPASPPAAARTTSQTSEVLPWTSLDRPPAQGTSSLPQQWDPNTLNIEGYCKLTVIGDHLCINQYINNRTNLKGDTLADEPTLTYSLRGLSHFKVRELRGYHHIQYFDAIQLQPCGSSYSNLALYKAGDVFTGVKNRQRPHDVLLQPIPVLDNLFFGDTWPNIK